VKGEKYIEAVQFLLRCYNCEISSGICFDYWFFLAQIVMETPECQKLVVLVLAERPAEAPASALEPQFLERGVVMESWISS